MSAPRKISTAVIPVFQTPQQAAEFLGVARSHLRKLHKAGKIRAKREGDRRRFVTASLLAYAESLPDA